jgi:squalene synthase HpnC
MIRAALKHRPQAPIPVEPPLGIGPPEGIWSVARSYQYCEQVVRAHYENFPVASRLVPARLRPHLWAVYAFARSADDFADEPRFAGRRTQALDYWEQELSRCAHGEAEHPIFIALAETIDRCDLPITPLEELLASFRMDLAVRRYATYRDLCEFTRLSAQPVGRTVLYVFGHRDPELHRYSDEVCTALQQANLWQDVGLDAARDRIYVPAEDLHHFGVAEADVLSLRPTDAWRRLCRFEVARTRSLFERGRPLLDAVGPGLGLELRLIWLSGMAVLGRIEAARYDVFGQRPTLRPVDKARLVAHALAWRLVRR